MAIAAVSRGPRLGAAALCLDRADATMAADLQVASPSIWCTSGEASAQNHVPPQSALCDTVSPDSDYPSFRRLLQSSWLVHVVI